MPTIDTSARAAAAPKIPNVVAERNDSLDQLLDSLLSSMNFFGGNNGIVRGGTVTGQMNDLFDLAKQLKISKTYENSNEELWNQVLKWYQCAYICCVTRVPSLI
jgi:hypothetical protein